MLHSAPESYGLTERQTLAHRVASTPPAHFDEFWQEFREEVAALSPHWHGRVDDEVNTVVIPSIRSVRVSARVTVPAAPVRAVVLTTHGYAPPEVFSPEPEPWTEHEVATVRLRVRGFPPSTLDVPDRRRTWIVHDIHAADDWILRSAIADVLAAAGCARHHFGPRCPLFLHGESFGGGLAVLAAAQLTRSGTPPDRLAIGLPSLGDWQWRRGRYCNGFGRLVNHELCSLRQEDHDLRQTLLLFDAAHHAAAVGGPTLCRLALRDDVVPAPAAAAVFNGLGSSERWRFVTRYGHYDGGIANARRHLAFERLQRTFLDPTQEPMQAIARSPVPLELEPR